ncbi:hypothetical protein [Pararhizobium polonicum]|uniref:hypothetical protein n=1 Tax=Pararhizobium polonicum TaxID=1612624 RepID=UPI00083A08B7|nr:hypothetical protein [Pararhizobium polonicum]
MSRLLRSLPIVAAAMLSPVSAFAEDPVFHGRWQQVDSNAGRCNTCLIAIVRHGELLTVTANNGWSAVIQADRRGQAPFSTGTGQWQNKASAVYSNAPFELGFARRGEQLHILMMVKSDDGTTNAIRAVFSRPVPEINKRRGLPPVSRIGFSNLAHPGKPR